MALNMDGIVKLMLQKAPATMSQILKVSPVKKGPLQQEFPITAKPELDNLYELTDGTFLNIEHQSNLANPEELARRMALYEIAFSQFYKKTVLRQVVLYIPTRKSGGDRIPQAIGFSAAADGHGHMFSAPVISLKSVSSEVFERADDLPGLMLGLLGPGFETPGYLEKLLDKMRSLPDVEKLDALETLVLAANLTDNIDQLTKIGAFDMTSILEEIKDRPGIQQIVEIAGKERIARERAEAERQGEALGLAKAIALTAHDIDSHVEVESLVVSLVTYADEDKLLDMVRNMHTMTNIADFLTSHHVRIPGYRT